MNCPKCGASTSQGSGGGWVCFTCGWTSGVAAHPATLPVLERTQRVHHAERAGRDTRAHPTAH